MDAVEFLKVSARMLGVDRLGCNAFCAKCPFYIASKAKNVGCKEFSLLYPEEAVSIVQKWAESHPVKTRAKDFLEKHPSAPLEDGYPVACAEFCGYGACEEKPPKSCQKCWNRPLEEEK